MQVPVYHAGLDRYSLLDEKAAAQATVRGWQVVRHPDDPRYEPPQPEPDKPAKPRRAPTLGQPATTEE